MMKRVNTKYVKEYILKSVGTNSFEPFNDKYKIIVKDIT